MVLSPSPRLLVTGASGFVGAAVVRAAVERGLAVSAVVRPGSPATRLEPFAGEVEILHADLADAAQISDAVVAARPDACIHLAAAGAVTRSDDLEVLLATNALGPALLARALAATGCHRLVTAGSSSEYGPVDVAMDEVRTVPAPDDPYGVAKLAGGLLARVIARPLGLQTVHARLFSVYGPGEDPQRLVASVVAALLQHRPIDLSPGEQVRDFVYVDDVAAALLDAALRPGLDDLVVNLGTGLQTSVRELCLLAAELTGADPRLLRFGARPYRPGERFAWRAATTRADWLGFRSATSLREGLTRTIAHAPREELLAA